jgi:hypothetical protein
MKVSTEIIISLTIILICSILSVAIYKYQERTLLMKNIELAMNKGVDPIAVRCAYAGHDDSICITYSLKK